MHLIFVFQSYFMVHKDKANPMGSAIAIIYAMMHEQRKDDRWFSISEIKNLVDKYNSESDRLLIEEIQYTIEEVQKYRSGAFFATKLEGEKIIGYRIHGIKAVHSK